MIRDRRWARVSGLVLGAALVVIALVSGSRLAADRADARATGRVSADTTALLTDLPNAETGQRGYLLTAQAQYLDPYDAGIAAARGDLDRLTGDVRPTPAAAGRLPKLRSLVSSKLGELTLTVTLARTGRPPQALAILRENTGQQLRDQVRQGIAAVQDASQASGSSSGGSASRDLAVLSVAVVVLVAGAVLFAVVVRPLQARSRRWQLSSEHDRVERAVSDARFRLSFDEAPLAMALTDLDPADHPGRCLMVNRALCELTVFSRQQLLG